MVLALPVLAPLALAVLEVALLISGNDLWGSLLIPFQSLPAEKENGAVLCLHLVDMRRLALDNGRPLALMSPESDNDPISDGKAYHDNLPCRRYLLLIIHPG